jgi:ATP-dependent protease ClpP protease subunit
VVSRFDVSIRQIDQATLSALEQSIDSCHATCKDACEVKITSKGGDVDVGLRMIRLIKESPVSVNATVVGAAGSTAAVVLQCCKIRRMTKSATLQYHYGSWRVSFLVYFDDEIAERNRVNGTRYQNALIEPIVARTGMSAKNADKLLREARDLGSQEALDLGLIDEIV